MGGEGRKMPRLGGAGPLAPRRRRASLEARGYEALYLHMIEGAALHRMVLDPRGRPEDYVIIETNPAFETQLGISRESVVGKTSREAYGVPEAPYLDLYAEVVASGKARVFETFFPALDKHFAISVYRPYEGHFATIFEDITERKRAEADLTEFNRRFRNLATSVPGYIAYLDAATLRYEFVNEAFVRSFGPARGELVGLTAAEALGPEVYALARPSLERAQRGEKASYENLFDLAEGRRWLNVNYSPIFGSDGKVESIAILGYDITELKRKEEEVRSLLKEKELVLREVHHRIKNNMNSICSLLGLQAETSRDEAVRTALIDASARVRAMLLLYDRLYRSEQLGLVRALDYFPPLVDAILEDLPRPEGLVVEKSVDDLVIDQAVAQPLGIILNELVTNAMKYAFPEGRGGRLSVRLSGGSGPTRLSVADDGKGLPPGLDKPGSGGFGLLLVSSLAEQIGGHMRIEPGPGASIVVEF